MLRSLFLFLSHRKALRRWMETSSLSHRFTRRFVAGDTLEQELSVLRDLNGQKILATVDRLGENVTSLEEAARSRDAYIGVLNEIAARGIDATISVKLTQVGLDLSLDACMENVRKLVARAKELSNRVEIDMESSEYVDRTLEVVRRQHEEFGCVRAVVQAYLYRTAADIDGLCERGIPVRLCKGAYREPESVAFPRKGDVDRNYVKLMKVLLDCGRDPAIATHDPKIQEEALRSIRDKRIDTGSFEFQMLYGIRRDLQRKLVDAGYRLRLYVPYGTAWYPYFMRRLAERPANVLFLMKNLIRA